MREKTANQEPFPSEAEILPTEEEFVSLAGDFDLIPLVMRMAGDAETPLTVWRKINGDSLLETVEKQGGAGRFSLVGRGRLLGITVRDRMVRFEGFDKKPVCEEEADNPWLCISEKIEALRVYVPKTVPSVFLSVIGFVGYEAASWSEKVPRRTNEGPIPDARLVLPEIMVGCDAFDRSLWLIFWVQSGEDHRGAYRRAASCLCETQGLLSREAETENSGNSRGEAVVTKSSSTAEEYRAKVGSLKEYIEAGELVQGVLARHMTIENAPQPMTVYRSLRVQNPSPYHFYLDYGGYCLVGASPEMMVRLNEDDLTIRPIAGTRPRGADDLSDSVFEEELRADEKERAEHLMLVDLARNDIGRVAVTGSVTVKEFMKVERFSQVMHLVSTVSGRLRRGRGIFDVLAACFPAGTLTGAPKVRAMEIIGNLEGQARGPYGGAVLRIGFAGDIDSCIIIRAVVFEGHRATVSAGAGIVHHSSPEREFAECMSKAGAALQALGIRNGGGDYGSLD